jgi:hypothetical protein
VPEPELLELELLELELPELDDLLALAPPVLDAELPRWLVVACADPGRLTATPAAVSMLARPAAAVIRRSLARLRSLAAICGARPPVPAGTVPGWTVPGWSGPGVIGCLPLEADTSRLASRLLKTLCARWQSAQRVERTRHSGNRGAAVRGRQPASPSSPGSVDKLWTARWKAAMHTG